jgi:hypothetical protein
VQADNASITTAASNGPTLTGLPRRGNARDCWLHPHGKLDDVSIMANHPLARTLQHKLRIRIICNQIDALTDDV